MPTPTFLEKQSTSKLTAEWNALLDPFAKEDNWLPVAIAVGRLGLIKSQNNDQCTKNKKQPLVSKIIFVFLFLLFFTIFAKQIISDRYRNYGYRLMTEQSTLAEAVKAFDIAIKTSNGQNSDNYFQKAYCEEFLGHYNSAIADYKKSIALDPKNPFSYQNIGWCYEDIGNKELALASYTKSILLAPQIGFFYTDRGRVLTDLGKLEEANKDFNKALPFANADINSYPTAGSDVGALRERARIFNGLQKYDLAFADACQAITLSPKFYSAYKTRAISSIGRKDFISAIADLNTFNQAVPNYPETFFKLALAYEGLGNSSMATVQRHKAEQLIQQAQNSD